MLNGNEKCEYCKQTITWNEYKYSMNVFKKSLCFNCQCDERKKTLPPKMANFLNKTIASNKSGGHKP